MFFYVLRLLCVNILRYVSYGRSRMSLIMLCLVLVIPPSGSIFVLEFPPRTLTHICIPLTSECSRNFDLVMTPSGQTNMKLEYWDRMTDSSRLVLAQRHVETGHELFLSLYYHVLSLQLRSHLQALLLTR